MNKIIKCLDILFAELGVTGALRNAAAVWLLNHRDACIRAFDKVEAVIKSG